MKTSNFVVLALTLLGVIDASRKKGGRRQIPRTRATETVGAASTEASEVDPTLGISASSRPFPAHRLLLMAMKGIPQTSAAVAEVMDHFADVKETEKADDAISLKSLSDNEVSGLKVISKSPNAELCKKKSNKKRASDDFDKFDEDAAVNALLCMSKSGGDAEIYVEDSSDKHKSKKEKKEKALPPLLDLTEKILINDKIKNYARYFDERNMATVGSETLFRCMSSSMSQKLATYLIKHGARLADTEESAVIALMAKEEGEGLRTQLFRVLLEEDPVSVARIFVRAAEMTEADDESVDMFLFGLLVDLVDGMVEFQPEVLMSVIEVLAESDLMANTLALLFGDGERVIGLVAKALKSGRVSFIEHVLELELLNINDKISVSSQGKVQTLASAFFGRIEANKIFDFMQRFEYDMTTANNPTLNPEGDILLSALAVKDLKSFKKLLLLGASLNVRIGEQLLEEYVRENDEQEFYAAILSFKSGKLQAELEAEEAEEIDAPDAMLSAPVTASSSAATNTTEGDLIDLSDD